MSFVKPMPDTHISTQKRGAKPGRIFMLEVSKIRIHYFNNPNSNENKISWARSNQTASHICHQVTTL